MVGWLGRTWEGLRRGFKPREVEEPVDYYWHRPLASLLVRWLATTRITPNQVTYASGVASALSGLALMAAAWVERSLAVLGAALLLVSIVLDCADGQLARIRGSSSPLGRILDGAMDAVAPLFVFHGLGFFLVAQGWGYGLVWPIGWAAAGSLIWHASVYDASKNVWLHATRPDFSLGGSTLLAPEDMRRFEQEFAARGERWHAALMRLWARWTRPQLATLAPWLEGDRRPRDERERALFRACFGRAMAVLTWLGFGTHLFLLTVAALLAPLEPRAIWAAWLLMLGPMNLLCAWVVLGRARRERAYDAALAALRGPAPSPRR